MKYRDISPTMRNFLGGFEAFRAIGFPSDDIFFLISGNQFGILSAFCVLKTQGKEFSIECGPVESEVSAALEYRRVAEAISKKEVSQTVLDRIWQESTACQRRVELVVAIGLKGIEVPDGGEGLN